MNLKDKFPYEFGWWVEDQSRKCWWRVDGSWILQGNPFEDFGIFPDCIIRDDSSAESRKLLADGKIEKREDRGDILFRYVGENYTFDIWDKMELESIPIYEAPWGKLMYERTPNARDGKRLRSFDHEIRSRDEALEVARGKLAFDVEMSFRNVKLFKENVKRAIKDGGSPLEVQDSQEAARGVLANAKKNKREFFQFLEKFDLEVPKSIRDLEALDES